MSQPLKLDSSWKWDLPQHEVMPVHDAVRNKSAEMMQFLDDCDLDLLDNYYNTPLHVAVLENKSEWIEALVKAGASPDIKNHDNETPQELATRLNNQECIEAFNVGQALSESQVMFNSWIEISNDRRENTPLHQAISSKYEALHFQNQREWENWKNVQDPNGNTPLHLAVFLKKSEWITALLRAGADPNIQNDEGKIPRDLGSEAIATN